MVTGPRINRNLTSLPRVNRPPLVRVRSSILMLIAALLFYTAGCAEMHAEGSLSGIATGCFVLGSVFMNPVWMKKSPVLKWWQTVLILAILLLLLAAHLWRRSGGSGYPVREPAPDWTVFLAQPLPLAVLWIALCGLAVFIWRRGIYLTNEEVAERDSRTAARMLPKPPEDW